ncbi:MAG: alpha-1,4-glucan--maltose-1-phosphate maltosyltransferase [Candidatus Omnitrophica bacterium]|nr:alpha-1,4-glucan--maltose-1-phosphate maltosyltransferase [Candidatus Omnitrophota bacterium]
MAKKAASKDDPPAAAVAKPAPEAKISSDAKPTPVAKPASAVRSAPASRVPRIIIEKVTPQVDGGKYPVKRVVGERVVVRADVFGDGHDEVLAFLLYREASGSGWNKVRMKPLGNDLWIGSFNVENETDYCYAVRGYPDEFSTWRHDLQKRLEAGQDVTVELAIGARLVSDAASRAQGSQAEKLAGWAALLAHPKDLKASAVLATGEELSHVMEAHLDEAKSSTSPELLVKVDRKRASFSSWYEFFPRSWAATPGKHGTFKDCARILPEIARMGFDIVYLPPIHPIGVKHRKGKNNATKCSPGEPGCPWAIGSSEGGHKAIHPELGTLEDFKAFIGQAREHGLEVALDIALQCSPDHPYVKEHPEWFKWRPDGTVQYAENPPKKYEDVLPINFDTTDREGLWQELKSIFIYWAEQGVKVFRVDNPHTKPFLFWDWLIAEVKQAHPDALFLSEAFTRPKVMYRLAKGGFSQSYTYFTWRNTKKEFEEYLTELAQTEVAEFFRPNFWPNTPDILAEHLQFGNRNTFMFRTVLAATLSSNWGIYGPAFELCVSDALAGKEEYNDSEKYEIKRWDWDRPGNIKDLIARLNRIRRENPALQMTRNIRFCQVENDQLLAYYKATRDFSNIVLTVVNLDPHHKQGGWLKVPLHELGIEPGKPYRVHDLLTGEQYIWQGERNFVEPDPAKAPAHIIQISKQLHREQDFDYFL